MLQDKKSQAGSNMVKPLHTYKVWDFSGNNYRNDSCNVICALFIILDQIATDKLSFYGGKKFPYP